MENYEKKYKDALERAKKIVNDQNASSVWKGWLCNCFPELKKSEDEKIRKWLITQLELKSDVNNPHDLELMILKSIAWLEKQGEQKPIWHNEDEEPKRGSLILLIMQSGTPIVAKIIEPNHTFNHGERWAYIDDLLEKQGKQKSAEKVEPKFKIGDWITNDATNPAQISSIKDGMYFTHNDTIGGDIESIDKEYHLWVIKDAKDGDVLIYNHQPFKWIFIFKRLYSPIIVSYYVMFTEKNKIYIDDSISTNFLSKITPATKEQRDTLFAKMKEAGYEWDAEKKELKKQDIVEIPFGAKDSELKEAVYNIPKGFHAEIDGNKVIIKKGEQKSAWSEEDTETLNGIVNYLFTSTDVSSIEGSDKWYDWLKSLKDRVQPQSQWKPSDEQIGVIEAVINNTSFQRRHLDSLYEQLKKLKGE